MKKILLIAVLLGAMLSVTVYFVCIAAPSVFFGKGLKGSGNIVTRTIEAPAFDRIDAARAVKVVITDKTSGKITIAADDNIKTTQIYAKITNEKISRDMSALTERLGDKYRLAE